MKPHPKTAQQVEEILTGFTNPDIARIATQALAGEGLLNPAPADEHPEWIGVTSSIYVSADSTNRGSELLPIVLMNVRIDDRKLHFGLKPFVAQRLVEALNQALDDTAKTGDVHIIHTPHW